MFFHISLACAVVVCGALVFEDAFGWNLFSRNTLLVEMGMVGVSSSLFRCALGSLRSGRKTVQKVLFIGDQEEAAELQRVILREDQISLIGLLSWNRSTLETPAYRGRPVDLDRVAEETDPTHIVFGCREGQLGQQVRWQLLQKKLSGLSVSDVTTFYQATWARTPLRFVDEQWLLWARGFNGVSGATAERLKRLADFVFAVIGLVLAVPLMGLAAVCIKLDSRGPVLYRQQRMGWREKPFQLLKFRSMVVDHSNERGAARWTTVGDQRVTRVGRFLRRARLDELPQFWNVLMGDMSFVGPRPEQISIARRLAEINPYYSFRHVVRPGITGWAQVKAGYCASDQESLRKLEYDLYYVQHRTLLLDLQIVCRTVSVVLTGRGSR